MGQLHPRARARGASVSKLTLGAIGIVYGDIGTSPLYAIKECFGAEHGVPPSIENVLGVLSLVFWSLTFVIVVKYMSIIMRADNNGEGGILALLALMSPKKRGTKGHGHTSLIFCGLFGAALLYGDGIITPAISVLSAVEGLEVATTAFHPYIVPITVAILLALFLAQRRGTSGLGAIFGPAMLLWFLSIAACGLPWIIQAPRVLEALNPIHGARFLAESGWRGFLVLGAVTLCITGAEALYADMGHFGRRPIRLAWYFVVFPALILNYFGQGAMLIVSGKATVANPFYSLVPTWFLFPMVVIATTAAVIASQALISGAFSLTRQAMQLGYSPRVTIVHTSGEAEGQIYIPEVNTILMVSCIALVLVVQKSSNLTAAYGLAVTGTMAITSGLFVAVIRERWGTRIAVPLLILFLAWDLTFFSANAAKFAQGGWFPVVVAIAVFAVLTTWKRGRAALGDYAATLVMPMDLFMERVARTKPPRVHGTAVFLTSSSEGAPPVLLHHFTHNKVLHQQVVLMSVVTEPVPEVGGKRRVEVTDLGRGFFRVVARYGFMQTPNVPSIMKHLAIVGVRAEEDDTSFYLGRETLLPTGRSGLWPFRKGLFAFLSRNAQSPTVFYGIPPNRVVEIGMQIEL